MKTLNKVYLWLSGVLYNSDNKLLDKVSRESLNEEIGYPTGGGDIFPEKIVVYHSKMEYSIDDFGRYVLSCYTKGEDGSFSWNDIFFYEKESPNSIIKHFKKNLEPLVLEQLGVEV